MEITTEKEFRAYQAEMESLTTKGTALGDMDINQLHPDYIA